MHTLAFAENIKLTISRDALPLHPLVESFVGDHCGRLRLASSSPSSHAPGIHRNIACFGTSPVLLSNLFLANASVSTPLDAHSVETAAKYILG
jgi:hypothetical protein